MVAKVWEGWACSSLVGLILCVCSYVDKNEGFWGDSG